MTVKKTGDELEYEKIAVMSMRELLDYVLGQPHLLSDSYYRGYDKAIEKRHEQLTTIKTVMHVVMGNDFPAAVFSTEALAAAYCERRVKEELPGMRRIHWRHYAFELDKDREK